MAWKNKSNKTTHNQSQPIRLNETDRRQKRQKYRKRLPNRPQSGIMLLTEEYSVRKASVSGFPITTIYKEV